MCGIVGSFDPGSRGRTTDEVLVRMRDRMAHRGPDGAGIWRSGDGTCVFGHRRLSIIDLSSAADQPMRNREGTVSIIFNGEIYNHAELRTELMSIGVDDWMTHHSDTEVVLKAYETWGPSFVDRLYGDFAIVLYDGRTVGAPTMHLFRDRAGVKPLYVTRTTSGEWLFASEIRSLTEHPDVRVEMDLVALNHYFTFIVAPAPLTFFKSIFKIPAASHVVIDTGGRAVWRSFWDCVPSAANVLGTTDLSLQEAEDGLLDVMRRSIARRMVADVPFGVLLSGGVDSSVNVALMAELMDRPVTTFTIGYDQYDANNEFGFAQNVARQFGTDHHTRTIDGAQVLKFLPSLVELQDEPIADNVCIPLYFIAQLVRESGTTVVQVGEGADEHFLGYWWCQQYRDKYKNVYQPALRGVKAPLWKRLLGRLPDPPDVASVDLDIIDRARKGQEMFWGGAACFWGASRSRLIPDAARFQGTVDCPVEGMLPSSHVTTESHDVVAHYLSGLRGLSDPEVLQKITYLESKIRLPEHLLMRVDKMTMAHSVEARVPFLDHDVIEFANRLPLEYKLTDGTGKLVLKRLAKRVGIDPALIDRPKQGFGAPMDQWFQEPTFGPRLASALSSSSFASLGLIDMAHVKAMLDKQMAGSGGHGFHLWTVLNAVLWHERWIEGNADPLGVG